MTKKLIFTVLAVCLAMINVMAENNPYRSDFTWVTVPNHSDWLYNKGEKASVEIQLYKYGVPVNVDVKYELADDMLNTDKAGSMKLKNGKGVLNIGTRQTPGFRDLRLTATVDGVKTKHHIKVGFDVNNIKPWTKEPADFTEFWTKQIADMRKSPIKYTKELAKEYCTDKMDCYLIRLDVNAQRQCIYGYLFIPKHAKAGSCPAVLCPPGAGIKTIKEPLRHRCYGENGMIRFAVEIHGLDPRLPQQTFNEISNAFGGRDNGYFSNGIESRERYYMRHVYLAMVRALDFMTSLPEWDGRNLAVQGGSQGGALALVATALDNRVTLCCANHPALSDMGAYSAGLTGGYPHFNHIKEILTPTALKTLRRVPCSSKRESLTV